MFYICFALSGVVLVACVLTVVALTSWMFELQHRVKLHFLYFSLLYLLNAPEKQTGGPHRICFGVEIRPETFA